MNKPEYSTVSIEALSHIMADTYVLAIKTQNAHWNLKGPSFIGVHKLLDEHYGHLIAAVDVLAERIKALGGDAPGSMEEMLSLTRIGEHREPIQTLDDTIELLCNDHNRIRDLMLEHIPVITAAGDEGTADLLVERIREHDQDSWLLVAHAGN